MRISAVIHTYNREHLITETIDAVMAQTRPADEIVVLDDGSKDGTLDLLKERYGDKIKLVAHENSGCLAARKRAIDHASGDWIALCDSDDLWVENHLQRLCDLHAALPEADMLFSNFEEFGSAAVSKDKFAAAGSAYWESFTAIDDSFIDMGTGIVAKFLEFNPVFPSATMFRMAAYEELGGIELSFNRILSSDADLTRRFGVRHQTACNKEITVRVRKDGENISGNSIANGLGRIRILRECIEQGEPFTDYRAEFEKTIEITAIRAMEGAFSFRDFEAFHVAAHHVSWSRSPASLKVKRLIAGLPAPLRNLLVGIFGEKAVTSRTVT